MFWEFLVGMCRPVLQLLTPFQTKNCHFPHPFSDPALRLFKRYPADKLRSDITIQRINISGRMSELYGFVYNKGRQKSRESAREI